jgi:hypothetical protein
MILISGETLDEIEVQVATLRAGHDPGPPPPNAQLRQKLVELRRRTKKTTGQCWKLVRAVAARPNACTLDELKADLGLDHAGSVHSLLAVLGRPCGRLNVTVIENIGGSPTKYSMPTDVKALVSELGD